MKSMLSRIRWVVACLMAPLIVALHRLGKPAGFEAFNVVSGTTFSPANLQSHDDDPHWKTVRLPFTDAGALTAAAMKPGYLVKLNATNDGVLGAVAADDAVLGGVILDLPGAEETTVKTVAVALSGSFDKRTVKYADGAQPISAAGVVRLRDMNIFLDDTVPAGGFAP